MAKYSKKSGDKVERAMKEMKQGKLKSGKSGQKVTSRKQAIAIGLSEAREKGAKVPPDPNKKSAKKKSAPKKRSAAKKKSGPKKAAKKRSAPKKRTIAKKKPGPKKKAGRKS